MGAVVRCRPQPTGPADPGPMAPVAGASAGVDEFDWAVPIGDLAATKRAALACHGSQIGRLDGRDDWVTLADISEGRFLECFFDGYERFTGGAVRPG